ncbi:APC family permease [Geodermatophilus sp. SYSU D00710]
MRRPTPTALPGRSPVAGLRRRRLGLAEVLAQSVATLAPSAAMVAVPSIVLVQAGSRTLPALLCASVLVVLVGWCLTQFARRMAAVGGTYSYTAKGLGPGAALVGGWALVIGYAAVAMGALVGAGIYLAGAVGVRASTPAVLTGVVAVGVVVGACAIRGVRVSARVTLALEVVSITLVLVVLAALLAALPADGGTAAATVDRPVDWPAAAVGVVLWVIAFMGFESSATLGVEARRPLVTVSRAVLWTPVVAGVLFVLATVAQVALLGRAPLEVLTGPAPLAALADRGGLAWLPTALDLGIAASFSAGVAGAVNALARVLFSMGREGVLPRSLGRTHRRFETPHVALAAVLPAVVGVPVAALSLGAGPRAVLTDLLTVSVFGYVVAYALACSAMPAFLRRIGELTLPALVAGLATGGVWLVGLGVAVVGGSWGGGRTAALVFLGAMVPGLAWFALLRVRSPDRLRAVGVYDQATVGSVLPGSVRDGSGPRSRSLP